MQRLRDLIRCYFNFPISTVCRPCHPETLRPKGLLYCDLRPTRGPPPSSHKIIKKALASSGRHGWYICRSLKGPKWDPGVRASSDHLAPLWAMELCSNSASTIGTSDWVEAERAWTFQPIKDSFSELLKPGLVFLPPVKWPTTCHTLCVCLFSDQTVTYVCTFILFL